jgi:hypothetical protein
MTRSLSIAVAALGFSLAASAAQAGVCGWACGENGTSLNDVVLNSNDLQGVLYNGRGYNGIRYNGIRYNGASQQGAQVNDLRQQAEAEPLAVKAVILPSGETIRLE